MYLVVLIVQKEMKGTLSTPDQFQIVSTSHLLSSLNLHNLLWTKDNDIYHTLKRTNE